jgi:hypothetical protein
MPQTFYESESCPCLGTSLKGGVGLCSLHSVNGRVEYVRLFQVG